MRISRVHVESELVEGEHIAFDQNRNHYLKHVLRLKPGAAVDLFNGRDGKDYRATLTLDGKHLGAEIASSTARDTESPLSSSLLQASGRADHMDWLIQKATELGIHRILLFNAERTQHPIKAQQREKKLAHWRGVAISACEQCGRVRVPEIDFRSDLATTLEDAEAGLKLSLDFEGQPMAARLQTPPRALSILTGPEGGFSPAELETADARGFVRTTLGPRVLRFETAAIAALSLAQSLAGDLA